MTGTTVQRAKAWRYDEVQRLSSVIQLSSTSTRRRAEVTRGKDHDAMLATTYPVNAPRGFKVFVVCLTL